MHLTKKGKILLLTLVPAGAIATALGVSIPIVVMNEQEVLDKLNNAKEIQPSFVNKSTIDKLLKSDDYNNEFNVDYGYKILQFNPANYNEQFFVNKIANKSIKLINKNTHETSEGYSNEKLFNVMTDPNNKEVKYFVETVVFDATNNVFQALVRKEYSGRTKIYTTNINTKNMDWTFTNDLAISESNFLNYSISNLKTKVNANLINVQTKNIENINLENITQENLVIKSNNNDINIEANKNNYLINDIDKTFNYNYSSNINFELIPDSTKVWDFTKAWPTDSNGYFDFTADQTKSPLFHFLKSKKDSLKLPELNADNYKDFNYIIDTTANPFDQLSDEQKENIQIAKLIFDQSSGDPYATNNLNNRLQPNSSFAAIVVKLSLGNSSTYAVIWQNILQSSNASIVQNAPEIKLKVLGRWSWNPPTAQQIADSKNFADYLEFVTQVPNGLNYQITKVEIPTEENADKTKIKATVSVSSLGAPEITPKEYTIEIAIGIKGLKQEELDNQIAKLLGNNKEDLTPITPNGTMTKSTTIVELEELLTQPDKFKEKIQLTKKSGTDMLDYVPILVIPGPGNNQIQITYEIVSATDPLIKPSIYKTVDVIVNVV